MTKYRFCFLLTTAAGNKTRYANLRQVADRDPAVDIIWVPLSGYPPHEIAAKFGFIPNVWLSRFWTLRLLFPVLSRLNRFDAVMVHQFEAETLLVLAGYLRRIPVVISSTDEAPIVDETNYPLYDYQLARTAKRRKTRLKLDLWRTTRIDFFMPFTRWAARILEKDCAVPASRIMPLHVGLDLATWTRLPSSKRGNTEKVRILFVGGEFIRKGGDLLVQTFQSHLSGLAELHIVSGQAPVLDFPGIFVHKGLAPNSAELLQLYSDCDILALPTTADLVPWAYLEAMAMELPCVGTSVGATAEIIEQGVTGLIVPPADEPALRTALLSLVQDADLRRKMGGAARKRVEHDFDAAKNVPRILEMMKSLVDNRRAGFKP